MNNIYLLNKTQLLVACSQRGIKANSSLNKPELMRRLLEHQKEKKKIIFDKDAPEINFDEPEKKPEVKEQPKPEVKPEPKPTPPPAPKIVPISYKEVVQTPPKPVVNIPSDKSSVSSRDAPKLSQLDILMRCPVKKETQTEWHVLRTLYSISPSRFSLGQLPHYSGDDTILHWNLRVDTSSREGFKINTDYHIYFQYITDHKMNFIRATTLRYDARLNRKFPQDIAVFGRDNKSEN